MTTKVPKIKINSKEQKILKADAPPPPPPPPAHPLKKVNIILAGTPSSLQELEQEDP